MRVLLKLFSFIFGIFSLTFARGQECLSSDIQLENTEPLDKLSYNDGETVKVNCITGFSGMYRIKCLKGNWEMTLEQKCTKNNCGHPGDTPNGDFRLLGGNTEFVFGATVQYTCNKGYEMASKIYKLTCRSNGWDNAVPLCVRIDECLKPTQNLEFMTLFNKRNTYSNFEILKYSCNSPYNEIPEGAFMCQEGKWHGSFVCTSKTCPPPPYLENGDYTIKNQVNNVTTEVYYTCQSYYVLNKQQEYYKCLNGRWETSPKCLKPCKITPDIYKKYNIKPVPDNYTRHSDKDFRLDCNPGRTVEGLFNRRPYLTAWCTDGELRIESKCSICPPPPMIENGDFNVEQKTDEVITSVSYSCQNYFVLDQQQSYYRCLNGIWETPPKCLKPCKITPDFYREYNIIPIPGDYIRHSAEEVRFDCHDGWKVGGPWRQLYLTARCTDGELRIVKKCNEKEWIK